MRYPIVVEKAVNTTPPMCPICRAALLLAML